MKLNRKWMLLVALVLSVAMATTGTLAYLTDQDADVNVMTLGKVEIVQNEQERDEDGELQPFTPNKPALPAVYKEIQWDDERVTVGDTGYLVFADDMKNVVDKIVTVTNTGKNDAYIRTIIAIEEPAGMYEHAIHINVNDDDSIRTMGWENVEINGVRYAIAAFTYNEKLPAGETSAPSLMQVFLDKQVDNEDVEKLGDTWEILVLSQAVQADGFEEWGAEEALNEAFNNGEKLTATKAAEWFEGWNNWEENGEVGSPGDKWPNNNPPSTLAKVTEILADRPLVKTYDNGTTINIVNSGRKIALDDYGVMTDSGEVALDVAYQFQPAITAEEVKNNEYRYWHADFVVKADKDIPSYGIGLAGYYSLFGELITDEKWVMLAVNEKIPAGQEIRLVQEGLGVTLNFEEICNYGNDGIGFLCGAVALNGELNGAEELTPGTKLTVELRLYETEEPSAENGNSHNVETGEFITVGTFSYTFN